MNVSDQFRNSRLRLLAGWWTLLLYLGAFSPLGMGGAVVLGWLDADHEVVLQAGADQVRVVLHHRGNTTTHQHGAVARALTSFAQPVSATDPDHVLQFRTPPGLSNETERISTGKPVGAEICGRFPESAKSSAPLTHPLTLAAHPLPKVAAQILLLRSTVLLV